MKIVGREAFLELPTGTVYAKYASCFFEKWAVKGETLRREDGTAFDWFYQDLVTPNFTTAHDSGAWAEQLRLIEAGEPSPPLTFEVEGRDGRFDGDQLFAVYEDADVEALILRLIAARLDSNNAPAIVDTRPKGQDAKQGLGLPSGDGAEGNRPKGGQ